MKSSGLLVSIAMYAALGSLGAAAESWPSRPLHVIVPFGAGTTTDIVPRIVFEQVSAQLGQPIIVENRPGAGGVVASQALVASPPDGYTLMVVASGHATNPFLYPKMPYDTFRDFSPISLLASSLLRRW